MLGDEERQQIQREELAAAKAMQTRRQERRRLGARNAYRREVRHTLNPRVRLALTGLGTLALLAALGAALLPARQEAPDDTSGGIATSSLMERCEADLRARALQAVLRFPSRGEAAPQFSASPDGKRWDGSFSQAGQGGEAVQTEFSCIYTIATDQTSVELIAP
ncbi:hypothetical protein [Deinococcus sp.]|uniref:hypothetical protein n=1 Tax=Deinococcus sp. TaxID=47478 RepID=UPI003C7C79D1